MDAALPVTDDPVDLPEGWRPIDGIVDGLLADWHAWRSGYRHTRGYNAADSTCRDYSAPTHWDHRNGAEDDRAEDQIMRGVDRAVMRIPNVPRRWCTAIEFEARNLYVEASVWSSPVLPKDPAELEVLVLEARARLLRELQREGVLT